MPTTVNLLSLPSGLYSNYRSASGGTVLSDGSDWAVTGGVIEYISTEFLSKRRFVIRIAPSGSGPVTLTLPEEALRLGANGKKLSFNAKVKPLSQCFVSTLLEVDGGSSDEAFGSLIPGGLYSAVQSNAERVPSDEEGHSVSVSITFTLHEGSNIYLTYPNLIDDEAFYSNIYIPLLRNFMPDFYWEIDSSQKHPSYPFHRFFDVLTTTANEVYREYSAIYPYERFEVGSTALLPEAVSKSVLVDPFAVREKYIPWLSQFTGNRVRRNIPRTDGSPYFSDYALESSFVEWQLVNSYYGRMGGTRESVISAAKQVLFQTRDESESTFAIALTPNYQNDEWKILIRTIENETPDADIGESSKTLLAAIEPSRPIGYKIFHETVDVISFILDDISFGVLDVSNLGESGIPTGAPEGVTSEIESGPITDVFGDGETVTFYADHGFIVGSQVTISGVSPSEYNYSDKTITAVGQGYFSVSASDTSIYISGGSAICTESTNSESVRLWFTPLYVNGYENGSVIINYRYYLSDDNGASYSSGDLLSPEKGFPPITITGLSSGTAYLVKLSAVGDAGESDVLSSPFGFTTK
jgi:hypothetical protein